ncbi:MBL fold metallo-hydrolase [Candidatus Hodarchaeum mangrovi]
MSQLETIPDTIKKFYNLPLEEKQAFFIYSGWASIIFRTKEKILAFDIGEKGITTEALNSIQQLDLHLYSHTHWDHFSPRVIKKLFELTKAPLIAEPMVAKEIPNEIPRDRIKIPSKDEIIHISGFEITSTVGIHPRPITLFRVKWNETSIFHGADSGYVNLTKFNADLAFIPTGTPSPSCSPEKGLKMVIDIQPHIAIAIHGTTKQMQKFKELVEKKLPECSVIIPNMNQITKVAL